MARAHVREVLHQLHRRPGRSEDVTDVQLLEQFRASRDEGAFASLVQRYGPGVLRLCRHLLGHAQDAEDVFQATFLVLANRARTIRKSTAIGSWLFGVAYRLAHKSLASARRRRDVERRAAPITNTPASPDDITWRDLRQALDAELARLPDQLRAPLLLCYYDGLTQDEAARRLGWKPRTLKDRLQRGRALLHQRLSRRGITLSGALLGIALAHDVVAASVPLALVANTARAAAHLVSNPAGQVGKNVVSATVLSLTKEALRAMLWQKTKLAIMGSLVAATLLIGLGTWSRGALAPQAVAAQQDRLASAPSDDPPDQEAQRLTKARNDAIAYLKRAQKEGTWESLPKLPGVQSYDGGMTSLVLLALLRSGITAEDEAVRNGLAYLRKVEPDSTYVVALQTQVFALGEPKKDLALLQRNVDWLLKHRVRDGQNRFIGWAYPAPIKEPDHSNTQFAVMALAEAAKAGISLDDAIWQEIREHYLRTQSANGGWTYHGQNPQERSRLTMTCAGLCGLYLCSQQLKQTSPEVDRAMAKGMDRLSSLYTVDYSGFRYYNLHGLGRLGKLSGRTSFDSVQNPKPRDWFAEGSTLLLRDQQADGSWQGKNAVDGHPIIATSFALLFLQAKR